VRGESKPRETIVFDELTDLKIMEVENESLVIEEVSECGDFKTSGKKNFRGIEVPKVTVSPGVIS